MRSLLILISLLLSYGVSAENNNVSLESKFDTMIGTYTASRFDEDGRDRRGKNYIYCNMINMPWCARNYLKIVNYRRPTLTVRKAPDTNCLNGTYKVYYVDAFNRPAHEIPQDLEEFLDFYEMNAINFSNTLVGLNETIVIAPDQSVFLDIKRLPSQPDERCELLANAKRPTKVLYRENKITLSYIVVWNDPEHDEENKPMEYSITFKMEGNTLIIDQAQWNYEYNYSNKKLFHYFSVFNKSY